MAFQSQSRKECEGLITLDESVDVLYLENWHVSVGIWSPHVYLFYPIMVLSIMHAWHFYHRVQEVLVAQVRLSRDSRVGCFCPFIDFVSRLL